MIAQQLKNPKYQLLLDLLFLVENIHIFEMNWSTFHISNTICFPLLIFRSEMFPFLRRYHLTTISLSFIIIQNYLFQENIFWWFCSLQEVGQIFVVCNENKARTNLYDWYGNFRIEMISADTQHLNEINWEPLHCSTAATLNPCLEF